MHGLVVPCMTSKVDYVCVAYAPRACELMQFAVNESVVGPAPVGELENPDCCLVCDGGETIRHRLQVLQSSIRTATAPPGNCCPATC